MIGVIADDLTGAAEIGAIGLRHGLRAEILLTNGGSHSGGGIPATGNGKPWVEVANPNVASDANLLCVNTDSRACNPLEAGKRAAAAARTLRQAGARWIYKKVDSVLRGQVTAEVEAILNELQLKRALLAPANPSLGRVIRDGRYWVRDKPIHRTEFALDPEYPRKSSHVLQLLKPPEHFQIQVISTRARLPDTGIAVGEAATLREVQRWASLHDSQTLRAGGADFFNASLAVDGKELPTPVEEILPIQTAHRELFVCGTPSKTARQFLMTARQRKIPVFSLPLELSWGAEFSPVAAAAIGRRAVAAFQSHRRVILSVGLPLVRETAAARRLSGCLADICALILQQAKVERVFAEGGTTATELVRRIGWGRLSVMRELAPGVATLAVEGDKSLLLTIKPGSYLWPDI
jgi:uncharacterized protein YgbK (DUF1537 family)